MNAILRLILQKFQKYFFYIEISKTPEMVHYTSRIREKNKESRVISLNIFPLFWSQKIMSVSRIMWPEGPGNGSSLCTQQW